MQKIDFTTDCESAGGYENTVLYRMVAEKPKHDDVCVIKGKILLIGRVYSADVKRGAGKEENPNRTKFYDCLAAGMKEIGTDLDAHIQACKDLPRVCYKNLSIVLRAHSYLDDHIIKSIKGWREQFAKPLAEGEKERALTTRISFVSKYLHFHAPMAVFIYDSVVRGNLYDSVARGNLAAKIASRKALHSGLLKNWDVDKTPYAFHCLNMLDHIKSEINTYGKGWTPRLVDDHLYRYIKPRQAGVG